MQWWETLSRFTTYLNSILQSIHCIEIIKEASDDHLLDAEEILYLLDRNNSLDKRLALVNAKSWSARDYVNKGQNPLNIIEAGYVYFGLDSSKGVSILPDDIQFLMIYAYAMENYHDPKESFLLLLTLDKEFIKKNLYSYQLVFNLVNGNRFLRQSFCDVWNVSKSFFEEPGFEEVFRKEAMEIIKMYLIGYKKHCHK